MSARATKKINRINKKPAKRVPAKDRPKRSAGHSARTKKPTRPSKSVKKAESKRPRNKTKPANKAGPNAKRGQAAKSPRQVPKSKLRSPEFAKLAAANRRAAERLAQEKARAVERKARETAKKVSQQLRLREAKRQAEEKLKQAESRRREAERVRAQKLKVADLKRKDAERRTAQKLKEAETKRKELERQRLAFELHKRREAEQKAREQEKARLAAGKLAEREAQRKAVELEKLQRQQEREAARLAKEQERAQQKALRDAEREEARRQKEEERAKREAEREAYRKAKEAEREKIRAAKEAARRALEGRIAEATRNANKLGGGRSTTTRIYSPKAIPDQSGTTRRLQTPTPLPSPFVDSESSQLESAPPAAAAPLTPAAANESPTKPPVDGLLSAEDEAARAAERAQPIPENVEDRYRAIEERLKAAPDGFNRDYRETIDMSWIHHDSALEGVVYTFQELKTAIDPATAVVTDSSLQPVIEEIRRHKQAIDLVRDLGERKRAPITVDTVKKIYVTLHPEEGDIKTVKYRRDIPQHRLYFHEYSHPEKITYKVRQVVDWFNGPEPKKLKSPIRVAARVHYELLRVFPFQTDSGKVARLVMNLILLRAGHPPAIIHSTERQRYYEALKGALPVLVQMVTESILNALASIEKLLDDHDIRIRT
jgi:hypothetical protein